jgi:hypothetical protein
MPSEIRPKLMPVKVPWRVASDTPCLRLISDESPSTTYVRFLAFFGLEQQFKRKETIHLETLSKPTIFYPPHETNLKLGPQEGTDQIVKITFASAVEAKMMRGFSDASALDYDMFDCSAMTYHPNKPIAIKDQSELLRWHREEWEKTGFCPDPCMYEVENSTWIKNINNQKNGCKHYIVVGHDAYVEVKAKDWKWESEGSLREPHK